MRLDFGHSMWTGRPIIDEIKIRLELSVQLALMATARRHRCLSVPLGAFSGAQTGHVDRLAPCGYFRSADWRCRLFWLGIVMILGRF